MDLNAVKMILKMREGIADDVVNVRRVLVDAGFAFDKIVGDCRMGGEHKLGAE
jgi:hypothetical protein